MGKPIEFVIVAVWGLIRNRPVLDIVVLSLSACAAVLVILHYGAILLGRVRGFPFCVSVGCIATSNKSFQAHVLILNHRPTNIVVTIRVCCKSNPEDPGHWYQNFQIEQLKEQIGPYEKTEGVVRVISEKPDLPQGEWYMSIVDMVTRRRTPLFKLTGCYPPKSLKQPESQKRLR